VEKKGKGRKHYNLNKTNQKRKGKETYINSISSVFWEKRNVSFLL
jgi:hypothetical protein